MGTCRRPAAYLVKFWTSKKPYAYCLFHGTDMRGNMRWRQVHIAHVERL